MTPIPTTLSYDRLKAALVGSSDYLDGDRAEHVARTLVSDGRFMNFYMAANICAMCDLMPVPDRQCVYTPVVQDPGGPDQLYRVVFITKFLDMAPASMRGAGRRFDPEGFVEHWNGLNWATICTMERLWHVPAQAVIDWHHHGLLTDGKTKQAAAFRMLEALPENG